MAKSVAVKKTGRVSHRVLVVEDDKVLLETLSAKLRRLGYEVSEAADGIAAEACVKTCRPCLIFLDILLPRKSGFDFLEDLRKCKNCAGVPVVVLSQLGEDDYIEKAKKFKVAEYMIKANHSLAEVAKIAERLLADCKCEQGGRKT
jgi:DNA-binding response OmpR family regulator